MDAERAHDLAIGALRLAQKFPFALQFLERRFCLTDSLLKQNVAGLDFPNPVGLAAGWDKNALAPAALSSLGFGFLELGTVTLKPEEGNPRPRIWRDRHEGWILNRVGFANAGAKAIRARLQNFRSQCVVGISLGKNISSPAANLVPEAAAMIEMLDPYADFFSLNLSSPNTPQRLELENPQFVRQALKEIKASGSLKKPLFVKIGPMTSEGQIKALAEALEDSGIDGVIAANSLPTDKGGLSGAPLRSLALKTTAKLYLLLKAQVPIIGVGGILRPEDAWVRITAGAKLVQIFSGFVFQGPSLIRKINEYFTSQLKAHGLKNINEARGIRAEELAA